jgi:hypothetical protein
MENDIWKIPWSTMRKPPLTGTRNFPFSILNFSFVIYLDVQNRERAAFGANTLRSSGNS